MTRLVLASASPRRAGLIHLVADDLAVEIRPADVDEDELARGVAVVDLAVELATAKALAARRPDDPPVLGVDTVVAHHGRPLAKPASTDEARRWVAAMAGDEIRVLTGHVIAWPDGSVDRRTVATTVRFRPFDTDELERYLATTEVTDKAGALELQGGAAPLVADTRGCPNNVAGLAPCAVRDLLARTTTPCTCTPPGV